MKIKVNLDNETVSIKGITPLEFGVFEALMSHVRMGAGDASDTAFTFFEAVEKSADSLDVLDVPSVSVSAMESDGAHENISVTINEPTIEVYVD